MITGPFAGLIQGQVRVHFNGAPWLSPQMLGPVSASVVVPPGAQNGICEIEVNGRRIFGTNCTIDRGSQPAGRHGGVFSRRSWVGPGEKIGVGFLPTVPTASKGNWALMAVGLGLAYMALKPTKKDK